MVTQGRNRLSLREAIEKWVRPGMHLHFASTPSRANAAILGLAQVYAGQDPRFVLSSTGFHSTAHLLALLKLGRRYIASFFGDNYPNPSPNALYQELDRAGQLEHWSLLTYVQSFRAAALGQTWATTASLADSTLATELAQAGRYRELDLGSAPARGLAAVAAMQPDVVFLHAPAADASGRALFSPPYAEGFFAALAARVGVILTTERVVDAALLDRYVGWLPIPAHRVLACIEVPRGAHPQPLYLATAELSAWSYRDDFAAYRWWRRLSQQPALLDEFRAQVLARDDVWSAYLEYVGARQRVRPRHEVMPSAASNATATGVSSSSASNVETPAMPAKGCVATEPSTHAKPAERSTILRDSGQPQQWLAARELYLRMLEGRFAAVLAGIGLAFGAARLARRMWIDGGGCTELELLVETGLCGLREDDEHPLDDFLLSSRNYAAAARLGSVESVLGVQVTGAATRCLAIVGAGHVAPCGSWNSTRIGGRLLVGSGGAADIAIGADEVLLVTRWERLVSAVEYVTGPGRRVSRVVTERGVLRRDLPPTESKRAGSGRKPQPWRLCATGLNGQELERLRGTCPWSDVELGSTQEQRTALEPLLTEQDTEE